jgi:hypothetical protein
MVHRIYIAFLFAGLLISTPIRAAVPTAEELLEPTRLSLITAGADLSPVLADIEKQTGNKLVDHTQSDVEPLADWNFSLSDREFWPLLDKFLDAASLDLDSQTSEGLAVVRREEGRVPRYGSAVYVGPFRLEVTQVSSRSLKRYYQEHDATVDLEIAWEPRLKPLMFTQPLSGLQLIADEKTPVEINDFQEEITAEARADSFAVDLALHLHLPPQQLSVISSLKGRIKALVATRDAEFRFDNLAKASNVEKNDGGMTVALETVRENQGLCELHMKLAFDKKLPEHVARGSWNFQNLTYLESGTGERIDHAGFESLARGERTLSLAYFFDVPIDKLGEYTWVYHAPVGIVEVPIEFQLKDVRLP